jgi:MarR family transcriptional regulator, transcriptional regulator for hemolysin
MPPQRPAKSAIPAEREVLFQLVDTARAMRTYMDQRVRRHGMTRAQWAVLLRLERHEGMTQAEMADALEIQPISLVRLIDRLCEQRQVERRPHESDRRANRLHLTPKGRETLERLAPLGHEIAGQLLAGFGESEMRQLMRRLLRIKDNIRTAPVSGPASGPVSGPVPQAGRRAANAGGRRHAG